jgi:Mrp family chromosome partitioning ATPase
MRHEQFGHDEEDEAGRQTKLLTVFTTKAVKRHKSLNRLVGAAAMQVWIVIAQKGGQSKTTLSTGFAVEAAREGASVVIPDADDRQESAL